MAERRRYLPMSTAGLLRYFEEEVGIKLKPEHVIAITIFFILLVAFARLAL